MISLIYRNNAVWSSEVNKGIRSYQTKFLKDETSKRHDLAKSSKAWWETRHDNFTTFLDLFVLIGILEEYRSVKSFQPDTFMNLGEIIEGRVWSEEENRHRDLSSCSSAVTHVTGTGGGNI